MFKWIPLLLVLLGVWWLALVVTGEFVGDSVLASGALLLGVGGFHLAVSRRVRKIANTEALLTYYTKVVHPALDAFMTGFEKRFPRADGDYDRRAMTEAATQLALAPLLSTIAGLDARMHQYGGIDRHVFNVVMAPGLALILITPQLEDAVAALTQPAQRRKLAAVRKAVLRSPVIQAAIRIARR